MIHMLNYLSFIFFSTIEFIGITFLGITVFRLRIQKKEYINVLILSLTLSFVSLLSRIYLENFSPFIPLILYLFSLKYVLNIYFRRSLFLGLLSYILFISIQTGLWLLLNRYDILPPTKISLFDYRGYFLQMFTFFVIMLICFVTRYIKEGFSFDPDDSLYKSPYLSNKVFLMVTIISMILLSYLYYKTSISSSFSYVYYSFISITIISFIILIYSYIRDKREATISHQISENKLKRR